VLLDGTRPGCFKIRFQGKTLKLYKAQQRQTSRLCIRFFVRSCHCHIYKRHQILFSGEFNFNPFFGLESWIGGVLLIGFTEEIVFRGFLLQKFEEIMDSKYANLLTAVLFLLIHFPKWYMQGNLFVAEFMVNSVLFMLLFSVLMAVLLKKTNSLWTCILIHSANNFAMFALGE